jgi:hypothetical protein
MRTPGHQRSDSVTPTGITSAATLTVLGIVSRSMAGERGYAGSSSGGGVAGVLDLWRWRWQWEW